ncbi:MAG: hypothetical protein V3T86_03375 [Planctomycetota bacterium]
MRCGLRLFLLFALTGPAVWADKPSENEVAAVVAELGEENWNELLQYRQRMVLHRIRKFRLLSDEKQATIRAGEGGLAKWLLAPKRHSGGHQLPHELKRLVGELPEEARADATKLVRFRKRQIELDEALRTLPAEERRTHFDGLFPEPFDRDMARAAKLKLRKRLAERLVELALPRMDAEAAAAGGWTEGQRKARMRAIYRERAEAATRRLSHELGTGGSPERRVEHIRRSLALVEGTRVFASPRERELIRYAMRPEDCPFLDLSFLGPKPDGDRAARRWKADFRLLGRLEILGHMNLPPAMLLHLAECGSPEDFLRAMQAVRGKRAKEPRRRRDNRKPR